MRLEPSVPLGLTEQEINRLIDAELTTVEAVAGAAFERIAAVARVRLGRAESAVEQARSLVDARSPVPNEATSSPDPARAGGPEGAVERLAEQLRQARRHVKELESKEDGRKVRKQLKRLLIVLESVQRAGHRGELSEPTLRQIHRVLEPLTETFEVFDGQGPKRSDLKALRWLVRDTRRVVQLVLRTADEDEG